jgi:alkanesulfonate monooxygenase SsuD/methylene tetrahydromethanopterin reductase-like flavin-dependent oxidoreductase (luciferase family)
VRVEFGLNIPAENRDRSRRAGFLAGIRRALDLVEGNFGSAWIVDHLMFDDTDVLESFTTLSHLAALYPRLTFGHRVVCHSFRNPALLAKMGANLQVLTDNRYVLGMGAGWHEQEYRAYGYEFASNRMRVEQLEEALQIIRALWTEDEVTFEGAHHRVTRARLEPKPEPPPPLMVGAFRPTMLRLTARYADRWDVSSVGVSQYRAMAAEFERQCDDVGRDPATVRRSWGGGCACAPTQAEAEAFTEGRWSATDEGADFGFVGTPAQVTDQMRQFVEAGVDTLIVDGGGFPNLTTLELLIDEVLPAFDG